MNDSSYLGGSNLLGHDISDDVDPTISADTLTWPNYVLLWINVTTGALGCCANGVVLFLLLAAKKLRVHPSYFLIKFQILLDFTACVLLVVSYSLELVRNGSAEVMRRWGSAICILFVSNGLMFIVLYAATTNLVIIALERYIKVVHPIKHRNIFRRWMLYVAAVISLCNGFTMNIPMFWTSMVGEDGVCYFYEIWPDTISKQVYAILLALWLYVASLAIMIYCYLHIVIKLRRITATVAPLPSTQDVHSHEGISKSQVNVIKTMVSISMTYALSSFCTYFGYVAWTFDENTAMDSFTMYYVNVVLYFMNVWLDPFIYFISNKEIRRMVPFNIGWKFRQRVNESTVPPDPVQG